MLQSDDPERLARRWGTILQREPRRDARGRYPALDHAALRFVTASDGRGEGLAGMVLETPRAAATLSAAQRGCRTDGESVLIGGVRFNLAAPAPRSAQSGASAWPAGSASRCSQGRSIGADAPARGTTYFA